jgi:hypothetical protein
LTGVVHGNGTSAFTAGAVALASEVSGTLPVANGGSGATTAAAARTAFGAASAGANSDITRLSGLTTSLSVSQGGIGTNSLTANKVLVGNSTSGVLQPANLHWDNTNSRLGVGDTTPSYAVDVAGDVNVSGAFRVNGTAVATTLDYAMVRMAPDSFNTEGASIPWSAGYLRGQITTNAAGTAFQLMAGKTYELECALSMWCSIAGGGFVQYFWSSNDSKLPLGIGQVVGTLYSTSYNIASSSQPKATTVYTPVTNTFVRVYLSLVTPGSQITRGDAGCYAVIRQLP